MKKIFLIIILAISIVLIKELIVSNFYATNTNTPNDTQSNIEEYDSLEIVNAFSTEKSDKFDEINGTEYRNTKYNFRINFPIGWTIDKGMTQNTVISATQLDSGKSISIQIMENSQVKLPERKKLTSEKKKELEEDLIQEFKVQNVTPYEIEIIDGYLNNFPAYIVSFKVMNRNGEEELEYQLTNYSTVVNGIQYQISFSMPTFLYTQEDKLMLRNVINSFRFELKYQYKK